MEKKEDYYVKKSTHMKKTLDPNYSLYSVKLIIQNGIKKEKM